MTERNYIIDVPCLEAAVEQTQQRFGCRGYVNAPLEQLSLKEAALNIQHTWMQENGFSPLKGKPLGTSSPLIQKDNQVRGFIHLLSQG